MTEPTSAAARSPRFDVQRVLAETPIAHVDFHAKIDSTNNRALELAAQTNWPRPVLVLAEEQTSGRGRGANQWHSRSGALTFSVLLDTETLPHVPGTGADRAAPRLPVADWPRASLVTGLAMGEALSQFVDSRKIGLKWPNDVYLDGRKVCGILVESTPQAPRQLVLGIGVNVNNSLAEAAPEVRQRAISLCELTGGPLDGNDVLIRILRKLLSYLSQVETDGAGLLAAWRRRCILTGKRIQLRTGQRTVDGLCEGIDDEGALGLRTSDGVERFFAGTVEHFPAF